LKVKLFYTKSLDKELHISELSSFFEEIEFLSIDDINKFEENSLINLFSKRGNNLLVLNFEELKEIKDLLNNSINKRFSVILYDPYEELFFESIPSYIFDILSKPLSKNKLAFSINKAYITLKNQTELNKLHTQYNVKSKEIQTLNSIGTALSTERDVDKLLETILLKCREITESDSGSLYIVRTKDDTEEDINNYFYNKELLFVLAQNDTKKFDFVQKPLELSKKSIAGYVALTGKPLSIEDAYNLPEDSEFSHNKSFDKVTNYICKSMLIVPMKNQKGELIGVIQLINKKRKYETKLESKEIVDKQVIEFDENDKNLVHSIASQAAILIDNTRLYHNIRNLFEGFIKASVTAIESRDPTTSGHSERVADLTVSLAVTVDSINVGKFKEVKFSSNDIREIKYASLLHDFGKIGVRENVLVKAKKLYPHELEILQYRFKYIKKCMELNFTKRKLEFLMENPKDKALEYFDELGKLYFEKMGELDSITNLILTSNEPSILPEEASDKLNTISNMYFEDIDDNNKIAYLTSYELESLSIKKGSLREDERLEIESHVSHTYEFLSKIPWTNELKKVPNIAHAHHEKLDGTGYPRRIVSENIPFQSKMMAISDIYDALTASDRPYKKAMPVEKALDILGFEVKGNKLDPELYKLFVDAKIFEVVKR